MRVEFQISGAAELERNLATLPARVEKTVIRQAVRAAQRPVLARAKANAAALPDSSVPGPDMSALIAANLVLRVNRYTKRGSYQMDVRLRGDNEGAPAEFVHTSEKNRRSYVPAAIEFGHGADPASAARPYLRPAVDGTIEESKRILARELELGILREAIKGRNRA